MIQKNRKAEKIGKIVKKKCFFSEKFNSITLLKFT